MKRYPLETFDQVMAALIRLRDDSPYYFRGLDQEEKLDISNDVQHWLKIAEKVDKIACDLVELCIEKATACAAVKEKDWLNGALALSVETDKHAEMISVLISRYMGEEVDPEEREVIRNKEIRDRLKEFGECCLRLANEAT